MNRKITIAVLAVIVLVVKVGLVLTLVARPSNCGRNSYALLACKQYAAMTQLTASDSGSNDFHIAMLNDEDAAEAVRSATSHWLAGATLLVRTNFSSGEKGRVPIIVCDHAFDNVPQPTIWNLYHKNPAHAVGYADGTTALISPSQFAAMDLSKFITLKSLATNNSIVEVQR